MSHLISLILTDQTDPDAVGACLGRRLEPCRTLSLQRQLQQHELAYVRRDGRWDSDTAIGALRISVNRNSRRRTKRKIRELRSRGLSADAIEREVSAWELEEDRAASRWRDSKLAELESWLDGLRSAIREAPAPYVGLLLHSYRSTLVDEVLPIIPRVRTDLSDCTPAALGIIEQDTLYEFC